MKNNLEIHEKNNMNIQEKHKNSWKNHENL